MIRAIMLVLARFANGPRPPCAPTPGCVPVNTGGSNGFGGACVCPPPTPPTTPSKKDASTQVGDHMEAFLLNLINNNLRDYVDRRGVIFFRLEDLIRSHETGTQMNMYHLGREMANSLGAVLECPICFESLGRRSRYMLCCSRHVCHSCVERWVYACISRGHHSCIVCNSHRLSALMSRGRRSWPSEMGALLEIFYLIMRLFQDN